MINQKRFKVITLPTSYTIFRSDSLEEVYEFLSDVDSLLLGDIRIECLVDDIEITADEFIKAWLEGERPGDLQMF